MVKQIISCSRRTDIPAFYYDWLQEVLKKGEIEKRNVKFPDVVYRYDLNPEAVKCIVLWSKNFDNVAKNPGVLKDYNLIFNYTITGYSIALEPNVPTYKESINTIEKLLKTYRPEQVRPRFDPIILSLEGEVNPTPEKIGKARLNQFEMTCRDLSSLGINNLTFSFLDLYPHVRKRLSDANFNFIDMNDNLKIRFTEKLYDISRKYNVDLFSCADSLIESVPGINKGHCIDAKLIRGLFPSCDKVSAAKDSSQRKACGCAKSIDIGGYLECNHKCIYCYQKTSF